MIINHLFEKYITVWLLFTARNSRSGSFSSLKGWNAISSWKDRSTQQIIRFKSMSTTNTMAELLVSSQSNSLTDVPLCSIALLAKLK
jgi:hypothetical protein